MDLLKSVIARAIRERRVLEIEYPSSKTGYPTLRKVHPHLLAFRRTKNNDVNCEIEAWQASGDELDWRDFKLDRITKYRLTDEYFSRRRDFNPNGKPWIAVVAAV